MMMVSHSCVYIKMYQNVHFNYVHLIPPLSGLKNDNLRKYTWGNSCILMKWNPDNPQN